MAQGPLTPRSLFLALVVAAGVLVVCTAFALGMGPEGFRLADLTTLGGSSDAALILQQARLPRVLLGALCGAALAMSGAALQALLRNPLADPYIVGVSGGAALGGSLAIVVGQRVLGTLHEGWLGTAAVPLGAYLGALLVLLLIYAAARAAGRASALSVLLCGVVFNSFCAALVSVLKLVVSAETAQSLLAWLMGSVASEPWPVVGVTAIYVGVGAVVLVAMAGRLQLLAQGDEAAARLGVSVERTRRAAYLATSLVVAGVVAVTGLIGFVGLMVPHLVRLGGRADARLVIPVSGLVGAGMLVVCDALSRGLFAVWGTEFPVGAITALLGSPAFLWLLRKQLRAHAGGA
ncbi:MAG: iron ABC transporter permease [Myxococcota bacterium]